MDLMDILAIFLVFAWIVGWLALPIGSPWIHALLVLAILLSVGGRYWRRRRMIP